jgi:hypothetical protein
MAVSTPFGFICCTIGGAVWFFVAHRRGPKFQKLLKRQQADNVLQKYEPFIVQSKNFP